jgi:hypothetical protein
MALNPDMLTPQTRLRALASDLRWTHASSALLSGFLLTLGLILYVWWPLVVDYVAQIPPGAIWWRYIDWLLVGIFAFMSASLMAGANLRRDLGLVLVGLIGGLVIEGWGTQTLLWSYYTAERPPLWIIPAWPIATLCIDRMVRILRRLLPESEILFKALYWVIFPAFLVLMIPFVWPTLDKPLTIMALALCILLILLNSQHRMSVLLFAAGSGLGYFLEVWGTTRLCWIYYTHEQPPLFAVLAHGMAALAFWRSGLLGQIMLRKWTDLPLLGSSQPLSSVSEK